MTEIVVRNAKEAADALARALNMRFGDITIRVSDGKTTLIRQGVTVKPEQAENLKL